MNQDINLSRCIELNDEINILIALTDGVDNSIDVVSFKIFLLFGSILHVYNIYSKDFR